MSGTFLLNHLIMNNFFKRTIFGVLFAAIMIGCILWCKYSFAFLCIVALSGMMGEFFRMTMGDRYRISRFLAVLAGVILFTFVFLWKGFNVPGRFIVLAMLPIFIVMVNSLYQKDKTDFGKFANVYTGILYIAVPMAMFNFVVFDAEGVYHGIGLLCFFAIIWGSDVGAYCFGMALGQKFGKKLCPEISPKKSWIGFWGGFLTALLVGWALGQIGLFKIPWYHCLCMAACMHVMGVYGDLMESQWKRHYAIKDSGTAIPGHGGFLDRFDSSLFAVPTGIIYLTIFNLI